MTNLFILCDHDIPSVGDVIFIPKAETKNEYLERTKYTIDAATPNQYGLNFEVDSLIEIKTTDSCGNEAKGYLSTVVSTPERITFYDCSLNSLIKYNCGWWDWETLTNAKLIEDSVLNGTRKSMI